MREAMGGALLLKLVMIFIVIYVCFLSIAINYSITFRVKNQIVNLIEEYEGYELAKDKIEEYVANVGYYRAFNAFNNERDCPGGESHSGYCIQPVIYADAKRGKHYRVTTYVAFDFPVIGRLMNFPVSGETNVIYDINEEAT